MTLAETHTRMPLNRRGSPPHLASHIAHRTSRTRAPADGQEETVNQIVILTVRGLRLESAVLVRSAVLRRLVRDGDGARTPSLLRPPSPIPNRMPSARCAESRRPTPPTTFWGRVAVENAALAMTCPGTRAPAHASPCRRCPTSRVRARSTGLLHQIRMRPQPSHLQRR